MASWCGVTGAGEGWGRVGVSWAEPPTACPLLSSRRTCALPPVLLTRPPAPSGQVLVEPLTFKALHRCLDSLAVAEAELAALLSGEGRKTYGGGEGLAGAKY